MTRGGGGVKNIEKMSDIICGWPLILCKIIIFLGWRKSRPQKSQIYRVKMRLELFLASQTFMQQDSLRSFSLKLHEFHSCKTPRRKLRNFMTPQLANNWEEFIMANKNTTTIIKAMTDVKNIPGPHHPYNIIVRRGA